MSYILDALRRADARRANDLTHGIGASATRVVFADTQPYRRGLPWPWVAGGLALLLAGFVAWHFWPLVAAPANTMPVAASAPAQPTPVPLSVVAPKTTPAIADRAPPSTATPVGSARALAGASAAQAPQPRGSASTALKDGRIQTLDELPAEIRAELPKLSITGSAYSENAAHRMLIINGQVMREKDEPAGGVVLEQIQPKGAVLRYKGMRYLLPY
jgi:general secretion pathway protein B